MKKIMVVGGAGYIGSHCSRILADRGYEVVVVDNLSTGHRKALDPRATFYDGDIRDFDFLDRVFKKEKVDAVVHFAAKSLVGVSMKEPIDYFDNNVNGTLVLLKAMVANEVKKIVFSSSAAVYGEQKVLPITEEAIPNPECTYGETKLQMEKMMKWADIAYGVRYVSLRYFNVAGALDNGEIGEDHNPETHLIPLILQVPLKKRPQISIFGDDYPTPDGTCIRDYIHVVDLIDAHIKALEYLFAGNKSDIFNLGSENGFSVKEMIQSAEKVVGQAIPQEVVSRRPGDPAILIASSKKAQEILHWKPRYTLDQMIETAYKFHKSHLNGYEDK